MANCPHCGAKLPDTGDAFCSECHNALDEPPAVSQYPQYSPWPKSEVMLGPPPGIVSAPYTDYQQVPWYRRSGTMTGFILGGFFCFPPLLWAACIICLTGDVYNNRVKKDGTLSRWSAGNKVAAVIILVLQAL